MNSRRFWARAGAILFALAAWQTAAAFVGQSILLSGPVEVVKRMSGLVLEKGFWSTVAFSLARIVAGFFTAFIAGILLAVLAGRFSLVETGLWPFVVTIKSVPVASFIIISLVWLTSKQLSQFISFLMVFPVIYSNVLAGLKATDPKMLEMAKVFRLPFKRRFLFVQLPQIRPFLVSACSVALGLSWKSGIAAEVIGIPTGSIGERLYMAKIYFDTADLFAWTLVIVLASQLFEKLFLWGLKAAFARWEKR